MRAAALAAAIAFAVPLAAGAADEQVTRKKVQAYLDLAAELFKSHDFDGALGELSRAEALSDLAVVRYNLARCYEELHKDLQAVVAYEKYLALADATSGAAARQKRARETVARLAPTLFGSLEVTCASAGSKVFVLELMQVPAACPFKVDKVPIGTYEVQTFAEGSAPTVTRVTVPAGKTVVVAAQATPAPPPVAEKPREPAAEPTPARDPSDKGAPHPLSEQGYSITAF
jgi:hypothetical protein